MAVNLITDDASVESLIAFLADTKIIALDTEFDRTKTLAPVFGLLQLAADGEIFLIDPLAVTNFAKLITTIVTGDYIVIMHASSEDLELLVNITKDIPIAYKLPKKVYDTQIAANFLNFGSNIGLGKLIEAKLGISLAKTQTRTDWLARPLTAEQIDYAALDVAYLEKLYTLFEREFALRPNLKSYFLSEMDLVCEYYTTEVQPYELYKKVKGTGDFTRPQLHMLRELCRIRYMLCLKHNIAISRFVKDHILVNIVRHEATDSQTYIKYGMNKRMVGRWGSRLAKVILTLKGKDDPIDPTFDAVGCNDTTRFLVKPMQDHLHKVAKHLAIDNSLLHSRRHIKEFLYHHLICKDEVVTTLERGWRGKILGDLSEFLQRKQ